MEETAVEMGDIIKEMGDHMPETLMWLCVLLPAVLAVLSLYEAAAVQAILFLSRGYMGQ